ncbi:MAG: C40 family peptidase [Rhodospirillales bacterium]|nr:C40 family peptidase [Rhodospirillales bacterium]MCB9995050.1 C40 family peptidase [Rhodospirillales bacterium]
MAVQYTNKNNQGPALSSGMNGGMGGFLQIIMAIFEALGFKDLAGSLKNLGGMSFADLQSHPTFQNALPENFELGDKDLNFTTAAELMADEGTREALVDATVRTAVSIGIEKYAEDAINRGVRYEFGAKSGVSAIDCSGFVKQALQTAMSGVRDGVNIDAPDVAIKAKFDSAVVNAANTSSEYQVQNLGREAGILRDSDITTENIRAGMVIGIDSGRKGWDAGRKLGIDHVGITYRDTETGKLMFAESASGKGGAHSMPFEDWLDKARSKGYQLYGVDVVQLAKVDYEQQQPKPDTAPTLAAESNPALNQQAATPPTNPAV